MTRPVRVYATPVPQSSPAQWWTGRARTIGSALRGAALTPSPPPWVSGRARAEADARGT